MPNVGDYFVVRTNGWAARLIQLGTGSKWNHAGVYLGNNQIVEARPVGVTLSELSKYDGKPIVWNTQIDTSLTEQKDLTLEPGLWNLLMMAMEFGQLSILH